MGEQPPDTKFILHM